MRSRTPVPGSASSVSLDFNKNTEMSFLHFVPGLPRKTLLGCKYIFFIGVCVYIKMNPEERLKLSLKQMLSDQKRAQKKTSSRAKSIRSLGKVTPSKAKENRARRIKKLNAKLNTIERQRRVLRKEQESVKKMKSREKRMAKLQIAAMRKKALSLKRKARETKARKKMELKCNPAAPGNYSRVMRELVPTPREIESLTQRSAAMLRKEVSANLRNMRAHASKCNPRFNDEKVRKKTKSKTRSLYIPNRPQFIPDIGRAVPICPVSEAAFAHAQHRLLKKNRTPKPVRKKKKRIAPVFMTNL